MSIAKEACLLNPIVTHLSCTRVSVLFFWHSLPSPFPLCVGGGSPLQVAPRFLSQLACCLQPVGGTGKRGQGEGQDQGIFFFSLALCSIPGSENPPPSVTPLVLDTLALVLAAHK